MSGQRGFTLIEMAMVVVLIGLMVGGGLFAIGPVILQGRITQTNANLDQIEAALVVFAIRNNRLPCPADGSLTNTNANYGLELQTAPGACDLAATPTNSVIPWRSLGLDETYSLDGWSNRIAYFPADNSIIPGTGTLVNSISGDNCLSRIATTSIPPSGSFRNATACDVDNNPVPPNVASGNYGTYSVPTYPFNNYIAVYVAANPFGKELTAANPAAAVTSTTVGSAGLRAAYVLISHGQSGFYAWNRGGHQVPPPQGANAVIKTYNAAGTAGTTDNLGFVQGTPQFITQQSNANYFDDIVRWRSPAYIIQNCGEAACGNP